MRAPRKHDGADRRTVGRWRGRRVALAASLVVIAATAGSARAQCIPPETSNEARLLAYYEAPLVFSPLLAPAAAKPGTVSIGGEATYIPRPDPTLERTGRCFTPKKESTRLSPVFPRPRLGISLPGGLRAEASYLPPIRVSGAQANLVSGSVAITHDVGSWRGSPFGATIRGHATRGWVRGAITCARGALQQEDRAAPCFGVAPSRDIFRPSSTGVEAMLSQHLRDGRVGIYAGAGMTWLRPRFEVNFRESTGLLLDTRVEVDLTRVALFTGAEWRVQGIWSATAQLYAVPEDVALLRVGGAASLR